MQQHKYVLYMYILEYNSYTLIMLSNVLKWFYRFLFLLLQDAWTTSWIVKEFLTTNKWESSFFFVFFLNNVLSVDIKNWDKHDNCIKSKITNIQADSLETFWFHQNRINMKIGNRLLSTAPSSNKIFSKWRHFRKWRKSTPSLFFFYGKPLFWLHISILP
jgi:hypothetical protein